MKKYYLQGFNIPAAATLAITWSAAFSAFAATVALALCVTDANAATLAPTTAHDDIPGDATLKEIVEGAGATEALEAETKERKAADEAEAKARDEAIAAETTARKEADAALVGSLSDLSDALTAETSARATGDNNAASSIATTARDLKIHASNTANPHNVTAAQVGALTAESDPSFGTWKADTRIAAGSGSKAGFCGVAIGCSAKSANGTKGDYGTAIGYGAISYANYGVAIGSGAFVKSAGVCGIAIGSGTVTNDSATAIGDETKSFGDYSFNINAPDPSHFYFAATNAATARNLQSYLDECVPSVAEKKYPLFLVRLNEDSSAPKFSDIELKATTNNYATFESMTFFAGTAVNGLDSSGYDFTPDWCRIYILSSKVDGDVRRWRRIRNTTDLGDYKPGDFAIIVDPAMFRRGQGDGWCSDQNEELTWSFVRLGSGTEDDAEKDTDGGTSQLWRPIMPVKWYSKLPAWADQTEYGTGN